MTIEQRSGGFRAQVMIDGKRLSDTFASRHAAKDWIALMKRRHNRGQAIELPSRDTLASVIERYIENDGDWSADKTHHLRAAQRDLGHLPLAKLTQVALIDYIHGRRVSPANNAARMSFLKSALDHADSVLHLNPRFDEYQAARKKLAKAKKIGKSQERTRRAKTGEIELIAEHHRADYRSLDLPAILQLLSLLPIRVGELLKIRWADIDRERRTVLLRSRKHPDKAERKDEVVPLLRIGDVDTYDLLITSRQRFGNQDGPFPYRVQAVSNSFAKAREAAGVDDLRVHDLRAHAISVMLEAGIEPLMVMLISGHKDPAVFFKHYVRLDIEKVRREMEKKLAA